MKTPNKRKLQQIASNHTSGTEFRSFGELKSYAKKPFSFLVNDTNLSSYSPLRFRKNLFKKTVSEKIARIDSKIKRKQSSIQFNLVRQTAKFSDLSSENVSKYEFITSL